jgi:hypothetical protein
MTGTLITAGVGITRPVSPPTRHAARAIRIARRPPFLETHYDM